MKPESHIIKESELKALDDFLAAGGTILHLVPATPVKGKSRWLAILKPPPGKRRNPMFVALEKARKEGKL